MDNKETQVEQDNKETQVEQDNDTDKKLVDMPVNDENAALNLLVGFIFLAHKRGVFSLEESSKIWECVKKFQKSA
jgi:hypothetical protein